MFATQNIPSTQKRDNWNVTSQTTPFGYNVVVCRRRGSESDKMLFADTPKAIKAKTNAKTQINESESRWEKKEAEKWEEDEEESLSDSLADERNLHIRCAQFILLEWILLYSFGGWMSGAIKRVHNDTSHS